MIGENPDSTKTPKTLDKTGILNIQNPQSGDIVSKTNQPGHVAPGSAEGVESQHERTSPEVPEIPDVLARLEEKVDQIGQTQEEDHRIVGELAKDFSDFKRTTLELEEAARFLNRVASKGRRRDGKNSSGAGSGA